MIEVIRYDEKPITLIGKCVGQCYGSDTTNDKKNYKRGLQCIIDGHGRVEEYPDIIVTIDGYSIKTIREFYTHIGGLPTRTQESTRYVDMKNRGYFIPPKIEANLNATIIYLDLMERAFVAYERLLALGIPKEDASMVLPVATLTKFTLKINVRSLLSMAQVRLCTRAYHEFRKLMYELIKVLSALSDEWRQLADMMKPKCEVVGYCTESKSCGRRLPKAAVMKMIEDYMAGKHDRMTRGQYEDQIR